MSVFVSHSRQNASVALKLCDLLVASGIGVWLDLRDLDLGADWTAQVRDAIKAADGVIVLVGPGAGWDEGQRFDWQQITENEIYLDPEKPLIPIVIGKTEIPGFLRTRTAIVMSESGIDFDALAGKVRDALGKPGDTIDAEKLEQGRQARQRALDGLKEYSQDLERADVKHAGLRGLK